MGRPQHNIPLPARNQKHNLYDEHDRVIEHVAEKNNPQPQNLPQRRVGSENSYIGYTGGLKEMDAAHKELESGAGLLLPPTP